jgi:hypothetical protein
VVLATGKGAYSAFFCFKKMGKAVLSVPAELKILLGMYQQGGKK